MKIIVNGSEREVPDGLTVAGVVARLSEAGAEGRGVAVAVEAMVVPRREWDDRELAEGERVEVVAAIQGG